MTVVDTGRLSADKRRRRHANIIWHDTRRRDNRRYCQPMANDSLLRDFFIDREALHRRLIGLNA